MSSNDEARRVPSALLDVRDVPLSKMPSMASAGIDGALQRVLPISPAVPVPVAAFSSAI